jgi:hypothetical protein
MTRRELSQVLEQMGGIVVRHGSKHDWYTNSQTSQSQPVPKHRELSEYLARHIVKRLSSDH